MLKLVENKLLKRLIFLFFVFFCSISQAQLTDFSFSVTKTDETCESNATLTFLVQNATPGATFTYSIFLLPDTSNPITVTSQSVYTGLNSGNYLIIATQNLAGESNSQQQNVTILDQVVALQYQLQGQNAVCVNNGTITVFVTQGQAVNYEIISGPILKPLQLSNIFTDLSAGIYVVRVYDTCGNAVVQTYTLFESPNSINISPVNTVTIIDCDHAIISQVLTAGEGVIFYPLTIEYTVTLPNGQTTVVTQTLTSGNDEFINISQNIPVATGEVVTYTLNIMDGCGTSYNTSGSLTVPTGAPELSVIPNGCNTNDYKVKNAINVVVSEAPSEFTSPLPYSIPTSGNNEYSITDYPSGDYVLEVTDLCGVVHTINFSVAPSNVGPASITVRLGCENGIGSLKISSAVGIVSAQLTAAPASAGFNTPVDVSNFFYGSPQAVSMNNLIPGVYEFTVVDGCGISYDLNATIQGYEEIKTINVIEHCGSYDLFFNHVTTPYVFMTYHLQKFYSDGNYWGNPITGQLNGGLLLTNNVIAYNIASSGHFRIIGRNFIYGNAGPTINCELVINEFDFLSEPKINSVFSFSCDSNGFDVLVDAEGISDLTYKIIAKNGEPYSVNNGNNPVFTGLTIGIYTFQIEDGCNNILIADYEVGGVQSFPISTDNLCPQQNATLSVADFSFLSYQWWKGTDTATILSTSSVLNLPNFEPTSDSGMYHVRVYYSGLSSSCIDVQSDYLVEETDYVVKAGEDGFIQFCGSPGTIDLFTFLEGNPDANGSWQELSNSGLLIDSTWDATSISEGIYDFKYTVTGLCNITDEALIQITINSLPEIINIAVSPFVCSGGIIEFTSDNVDNATYDWQGPNGFTSSLQNPTIENATSLNNGTYTLIVSVGNCELESVSVTVEIQSIPEFSIFAHCINDNTDYVIQAEPVDDTLNPDDYTYSWNGPSGYLGSDNLISILGKEFGIYTVIITDALGCSVTLSYEVKGTVCKIPKGISPNNDGDNDNFDLIGFNVKNLIIYSRYGRIVYEKKNYLNEWHGQDNNGRNLPDATYFYHIETEAGEEFVGWVYKIH